MTREESLQEPLTNRQRKAGLSHLSGNYIDFLFFARVAKPERFVAEPFLFRSSQVCTIVGILRWIDPPIGI